MKKIIVSFAAFLIAAPIALALQVIYSEDGINAGSSLRECPSQGVSKTTGKVIIGLHGVDDLTRMDCGWYRFLDLPKPDTNHYWRATNYVFTATGTCYKVWHEYHPKKKAINYCKADIITGLSRLGFGDTNKWEVLKAAIEQAGMMDLWNAATYIPSDDPRFLAAKPDIQQVLGMTEKELDDFLATCEY